MSERFKRVFEDGEAEEDSRLSDIQSKISSLKAISIDIGAEVREHNSLLDRMGTEFDSADGFLAQSLLQLKALSRTERGRGYLLYTLLFICGLFLFFYFIVF